MNQDESNKHLSKIISTDAFLFRNKMATESLQEHLIAYGYLCHFGVTGVEASIDFENKKLYYKLKLRPKHIKQYIKFRKKWEKYFSPITTWQKIQKVKLIKKSYLININDNLKKLLEQYISEFKDYELNIELISDRSDNLFIKLIRRLLGIY